MAEHFSGSTDKIPLSSNKVSHRSIKKWPDKSRSALCLSVHTHVAGCGMESYLVSALFSHHSAGPRSRIPSSAPRGGGWGLKTKSVRQLIRKARVRTQVSSLSVVRVETIQWQWLKWLLGVLSAALSSWSESPASRCLATKAAQSCPEGQGWKEASTQELGVAYSVLLN